MKPTPAPFTTRKIGEHRTLVTFPNGRRLLRPRFRRGQPVWGALRRKSVGSFALAFATGMVAMWLLIEIVAPFFDGQVTRALGN